ncbi:MAG: LTA synthase family protein [Clostridia bacterium]|nr:LTA synthase family protein [Clostridia bacterium]
MKQNKPPRKNKGLRISVYVFVGLVYLLAYVIFCLCTWAKAHFNATIEEIIFTLMNPLKGTDSSLVESGIRYCVPRILIFLAIYITVVVIDWRTRVSVSVWMKLKNVRLSINITLIARIMAACSCFLALFNSLSLADKQYGLFTFIENQRKSTNLYETYYVDPERADIRLRDGEEAPKNLLFIVLESMETSYGAKEKGGEQVGVSYIPALETLAENNVSFSDGDRLGGFHNVWGATWTMGALLAMTAGVPFAFPTTTNAMNLRENFAPGLYTMGDVLEDMGYTQEFLCGSDAEFGGRKTYFTSHGNYRCYDLYSARKDGLIAPDYHNGFWGYEDFYLYEIAKKELTELSAGSKPFHLTMLTVDTHFPVGYVCDLCGTEHAQTAGNVIACADRQLKAFLDWCEGQPFYEDTLIVIAGDHMRMDSCLVENVEQKDRTMYNCFINSAIIPQGRTKNRVFTTMDMFPTIMAGLGYVWKGERLGLGTNVFSTQPTLAEEIGYHTLNTEISKKSKYYQKNFY